MDEHLSERWTLDRTSWAYREFIRLSRDLAAREALNVEEELLSKGGRPLSSLRAEVERAREDLEPREKAFVRYWESSRGPQARALTHWREILAAELRREAPPIESEVKDD
jgi:hypothetical protein